MFHRAGRGADKFHDGWLVTGDVASIDSEYYMTIRDRSKDLIKSGREPGAPLALVPGGPLGLNTRSTPLP